MTYDKHKAVKRLVDAGCGVEYAKAIVVGIVEGVETDNEHRIARFNAAVNRMLGKVEKVLAQDRILGIIEDIESE